MAPPSHPPSSPAEERRLLGGLLRGWPAYRAGKLPGRPLWALFVCINSAITIGVLALVALATHAPFVFPSLGPAAYVLFFHPKMPTAAPRHAVFGHGIALLGGYFALWVTGLRHAPSTVAMGMTWPRVAAAAISLAVTGGAIVLAKCEHPPAGATALIVSLGIITRPRYLLIIELAVLVMVGQAIVINRLAGLDYPLWSPRHPPVQLPPKTPPPEPWV